MSRLIRQWFVCLLVLALPLQGMAAATMAFCGPDHHAATAPRQAVTDRHDHHDPHDHAPGPTDFHPHAAPLAADPPTAAADDAATHPTPSACSACAACCTAVALHSGLPTLPTGDAVGATPRSTAAAAPVFTTSGPERPPRPALA